MCNKKKNFKDCQSNDEIKLRSQQRFKRDHHNVTLRKSIKFH